MRAHGSSGFNRVVTTIETYRVIGRLSRGGMGDILLADRRRFDGSREQVALKLLSPDLQEEPYVSMFLGEATVMSQLDHPNVVRLLDMPVVNGSRCLALELVRGTNLYQLLRTSMRNDETLPVEVAVYIGLEVLAGLSYAHATKVDGVMINLVHRDVKPGNVLLSREGDVKLTDFGISKSDLSTLKTSRGIVKGTPHYLSPEQVKGEPVSPRSDLFSLAAVLVEAISGEPLLKRDTLASTLLSVSTGDFRRVAEILPRRHSALAAVLERALSIDPMQRYDSAAAMASALTVACPVDDTQARRELSRRVAAISEREDPLLGGSSTRRMHSTGAIPLEPADFSEDPTDESHDTSFRPDRSTVPISPPLHVLARSVKERKQTFMLGMLVGALIACGLQAALQLLSLSPW